MDTGSQFPFLSLILGLPAAGAFLIVFFRRSTPRTVGIFSVLILGLTLLISLVFPFIESPTLNGYQFTEKIPWIATLGVHYQLGLDGISYWFLELTLSISLICLAVSGHESMAQDKSFYAGFLLLTSATSGLLVATDIFLFIVFWGLSIGILFYLLPQKDERRVGAAGLRFLMSQFAGMLALILAFVLLYVTASRMTGYPSFSLIAFQNFNLPVGTQKWIFWLLWIGFASRLGLFPFHSWLSQTINQTSIPIAVFIGAVSLKMGLYGFIRFSIPLCPDAVITGSQTAVYLALISIVYGALLALVQADMKKLVAFSCISHMGFVTLGLFVLNNNGILGGLFHSIAHGFAYTLLILVIGWISRTYGTSLIQDFGGLNRMFPGLGAFFLLAGFAYLGLPGLSGFPGLFMIFSGTVAAQPVWAAVALTGLIIGTAYMSWMYQRIFTGPTSDIVARSAVRDHPGGKTVFLLTAFLIGWFGLYPQFIVRDIHPPAGRVVNIIKSHHMLRDYTSRNKMDSTKQKKSSFRLPTNPDMLQDD
ncbi:NADH-quinone oxidoreductase subunit M [bacterium]|nr:NADH-quinone oxidoreductase subunit M [candidate division CSSED10-310 bacterium]